VGFSNEKVRGGGGGWGGEGGGLQESEHQTARDLRLLQKKIGKDGVTKGGQERQKT